MAERDPFETRLTSAVHGFADGAITDVDAMAVAEQAIGRRRPRALSWLAYPLPVPVTMLALLGLLVLALSWALVAGGSRQDHSAVIPPAASPSPSAVASPSPTSTPMTDGVGPEMVARLGSATMVVSDPGTETREGDAVHIRGVGAGTDLLMNDRRASGTAGLTFDADVHGSTGPAWGTLTLTGSDGGWAGRCTGSTWDGRPSSAPVRAWSDASYAWSCWLAGTGGNADSTFYLQLGWRGSDPVEAQGLIYPGTIPAPSVAP